MKKQIIKIGLVALVTVFTSCATEKAYFLSSTHPDKNNFIIVKSNVQSTAKVTSVLGLGGHSKKSLVNVAKEQLLESSNLNNNQALANIKINWRMVVANPLLITSSCTVTADVVELKPVISITTTAFLDK
jgi:hypothetical protein